jgi:hypothetical protein
MCEAQSWFFGENLFDVELSFAEEQFFADDVDDVVVELDDEVRVSLEVSRSELVEPARILDAPRGESFECVCLDVGSTLGNIVRRGMPVGVYFFRDGCDHLQSVKQHPGRRRPARLTLRQAAVG